MPKVHAVNAIMIYADRPAELAKWYRENLGIGTVLSPVTPDAMASWVPGAMARRFTSGFIPRPSPWVTPLVR
jgi:hypothetical protein